jgi:hypothetical protein
MNKIFRQVSLNTLILALCSFLTVSLTGCMDNDNNLPQPQPVAYVSFYHGSPNVPDLDLLIDNQRINSQAFKYTNYSNYLNFVPGSRKIKFTPTNAANAFIDTTLTFKENKVYSLFVVDRLQNVDLMVVQDSIIVPTAGKAGIRVVHLSPDAPAVDVVTTGTGSTPTPLFTNLNFKAAPLFKEFTSGTYTLQVKKAGTNEILLTVPNVALDSGKDYSLILRGFVTPPTGNTNVLSMQSIRNY